MLMAGNIAIGGSRDTQTVHTQSMIGIASGEYCVFVFDFQGRGIRGNATRTPRPLPPPAGVRAGAACGDVPARESRQSEPVPRAEDVRAESRRRAGPAAPPRAPAPRTRPRPPAPPWPLRSRGNNARKSTIAEFLARTPWASRIDHTFLRTVPPCTLLIPRWTTCTDHNHTYYCASRMPNLLARGTRPTQSDIQLTVRAQCDLTSDATSRPSITPLMSSHDTRYATPPPMHARGRERWRRAPGSITCMHSATPLDRMALTSGRRRRGQHRHRGWRPSPSPG
jgi:hypothetical protein